MSNQRQLYVNLCVADLPRAKSFFAALGFAFEPRFTNEQAACLIINDATYVMLLTESHFSGFSKRRICDTSTSTEVLLALSCESREAVDAMVATAVANGGSHAMDPQDHGFMYGWSFYDPDGHHWEVGWMDLSAVPQADC
ncbi:MAG: VOC family protein [Myxococcales bacterium]|nr:VOC family protein [Myxococcales bacterium]MCA9701207.1 VOC family protein [Myxococcales bacterium]